MCKCSGSSIPSLPKKINLLVFFFIFNTSNWDFSWFYRHKRNVRTVRVWSCLRQRREMVSCRLGRLKCSVVNMAVHEWSCLCGLYVDEFQHLLTQSGQVFKAKTFNRFVILLVGLGGTTLMKKTMKWESGVFPCHGMAELPRILFGHERGNLKSTRLALIEWLKRGQRKWFLARYSGVGLVCAVNLDFGFQNKFLS